MDALLRITCGVTCHRELGGDGLHLMGHLCCQGDATVDIASQSDGDELVRVRSEVFSRDNSTITHITILDNCAVEVKTAVIVADLTQSQILDMQGAEWLEMLRVRALHVQLQRISQRIVLIEQCFADVWYPLVGIGIEVAVHRLACPQGDVVQVDDVVVSAAIDEGTDLTVSNRQRFFEIGGRFIVL